MEFIYENRRLSIVAIKYLDSEIPIPEAISTAMSIVAMYLLSKKYIEHWLLWIVVDVFYMIYNVVLGLYPTLVLYIVYTIVAIMGPGSSVFTAVVNTPNITLPALIIVLFLLSPACPAASRTMSLNSSM